MKHSLSLFALFIISITTSCGLKYTPQVLPEQREESRKDAIEQEIKKEFANRGMTYKSVGYGNSATIKPASYQKLDSLFEQKYALDQQGKTDRKLDEKINVQRLICQNDTNEILYMEQHIFTIQNDSIAEVLSGNFALNKNNVMRKVEFTESYEIPADLVKYYSYYIFEQSFLGNNYPTQAEANFYKSYKAELNKRVGAEKDAFLSATLNIMKCGNAIRSLEKQAILEALTRQYVHKGAKNFSNEYFLKVEQSVLNDGTIEFYNVDYQSDNQINGRTVNQKFSLYFDAYFMLTSMQEVGKL